ncbi:MAG: Tic20 family protein [Cyanobacteria bacterium P01_H01_bin.15]
MNSELDIKDRLFSALVYLIPLYYALPFGQFLLRQFPVLQIIEIPVIPIAIVYGSIPFAGFIVFIALYAAVINNPNISRFIRFNTMQAILIDVLLFVIGLIMSFVAQSFGATLITETLYNLVFLGSLAACVFGIVESIRGNYADLPVLSETVNNQVP